LTGQDYCFKFHAIHIRIWLVSDSLNFNYLLHLSVSIKNILLFFIFYYITLIFRIVIGSFDLNTSNLCFNSFYHIMLCRVHLACSGFEFTTLVVIGTDCIDSFKANHLLSDRSRPRRPIYEIRIYRKITKKSNIIYLGILINFNVIVMN
jgi:hypothetical protein